MKGYTRPKNALKLIEEVAYEFNIINGVYKIRINLGFNPNKPTRKYGAVKSFAHYESNDGIDWTKIN
jgi:hypothetical protein